MTVTVNISFSFHFSIFSFHVTFHLLMYTLSLKKEIERKETIPNCEALNMEFITQSYICTAKNQGPCTC